MNSNESERNEGGEETKVKKRENRIAVKHCVPKSNVLVNTINRTSRRKKKKSVYCSLTRFNSILMFANHTTTTTTTLST